MEIKWVSGSAWPSTFVYFEAILSCLAIYYDQDYIYYFQRMLLYAIWKTYPVEIIVALVKRTASLRNEVTRRMVGFTIVFIYEVLKFQIYLFWFI